LGTPPEGGCGILAAPCEPPRVSLLRICYNRATQYPRRLLLDYVVTQPCVALGRGNRSVPQNLLQRWQAATALNPLEFPGLGGQAQAELGRDRSLPGWRHFAQLRGAGGLAQARVSRNGEVHGGPRA